MTEWPLKVALRALHQAGNDHANVNSLRREHTTDGEAIIEVEKPTRSN
jgi:hypothetical protein